MIRVGVIGAAGRMGLLVCRAVADDPDLRLVAGITPSLDGEPLGPMIGRPKVDVTLSDGIDTLLQGTRRDCGAALPSVTGVRTSTHCRFSRTVQ